MESFQSGDFFFDSASVDDQGEAKNYFFTKPYEIFELKNLTELPQLLAWLDEAWKNGEWVAGYFTYECGLSLLEKRYQTFNPRPLPLAWWGKYQAPSSKNWVATEDAPIAVSKLSKESFTFSESPENFYKHLSLIKEQIALGETYQINYTQELSFSLPTDFEPWSFYQALRLKQPVPYSAFFKIGEIDVLSFSPELFFRTAEGLIETRPMKGTAARGRFLEEDLYILKALAADTKTQSENLMILDLHRNDLSQLAQTGSLRVTQQFQIEKYPTLFQMTSHVEAKLKPDVQFSTLFKALFPSGSITGAPKLRSMELIHTLENRPRGIYCGALGFLGPKQTAKMSVPIRTLELTKTQGKMGIGSGVLFDSDPQAEYQENLLKAQFLFEPPIPFELLETMYWDQKIFHFEDHLSRLKHSADYFNWELDRIALLAFLKKETSLIKEPGPVRLRLLMQEHGAFRLEVHPIRALRKPLIKISSEKTDSRDLFYFHKTTHRPLYQKYFQRTLEENISDFIFLNELGQLTEGTVHNLFIKKKGQEMLVTPPLSCGLLAGTARKRNLLFRALTKEQVLDLSDLKEAEAIFICSSMNPWQEVSLVE